ncbi:MAG: hypothetical protein Q6368_009475 [Candidatus Baldrarchaeota archaeon]
MTQKLAKDKNVSTDMSPVEEIKTNIEALKVAITRLSSRVKELENTLSNVVVEIGKTIGDAVIGAVREVTKDLKETSEKLLKASEEITKTVKEMNVKVNQSIDEIAKKDTLNQFMNEVRQFANIKAMELIIGLNALRGAVPQQTSSSAEKSKPSTLTHTPAATVASRQTYRKEERKRRTDEEEGLIRPSQLFRR